MGKNTLDPTRGLNLSLDFHSIHVRNPKISIRFPPNIEKRTRGRGRIAAVRQTADLVHVGSIPTPGSILFHFTYEIVDYFEYKIVIALI